MRELRRCCGSPARRCRCLRSLGTRDHSHCSRCTARTGCLSIGGLGCRAPPPTCLKNAKSHSLLRYVRDGKREDLRLRRHHQQVLYVTSSPIHYRHRRIKHVRSHSRQVHVRYLLCECRRKHQVVLVLVAPKRNGDSFHHPVISNLRKQS